jgi:NurA-like 5'-3' nuclease
VAICPQETVDCDRFCSNGDPACDAISGVSDRALFSSLLAPGERSAVFINPSAILKRYGAHQVYFFYLRVEDEIARIEVPEWVAMRPDLLAQTHSLVLDQCRRGQGYPVALSEAHEKAVVTGTDREEFWLLVEEAMEEEKLPTWHSTKSRSKLTRWV